mmetsp:Transcript_12197/g.28601  ORF Transcript_12197/g.28601 Transcript_12197/m.28601 type:complete len:177 (-) Transcript_12197:137-667(-)
MKVLASCTIALNAGLALGFAPRAPLALTRTVRPRSPEFSLTRVQSESDGRSIGAAVSPGGFNSAGEAGIEIRGFSLAKAGLAVGLTLTTLSFGEYFLADGGGAGLGSLGFIYGIPITLIGCALQYAELAPVTKKTLALLTLLKASAGDSRSRKDFVLCELKINPRLSYNPTAVQFM